MNIDVNTLDKILANWIKKYVKRIIYHDQVGFTPGNPQQFNIRKSINIIHNSNKGKKKLDHLNWYRKSTWQTQHLFVIKTLRELGIEGNFFNMINHVKTTANIILSGEKLNVFPLRHWQQLLTTATQYCTGTSNQSN